MFKLGGECLGKSIGDGCPVWTCLIWNPKCLKFQALSTDGTNSEKLHSLKQFNAQDY